jgi:predicted DNA-binding transcriptional regulator AlpA
MNQAHHPEPAIEPEAVPNGRPAAVHDRKAPIERLTLRFDEVAAALGVSRRLLERELSAGRFPRPDLHIGRVPLWRPETVRRWLDSQGGGQI